MTHAFRAVLAFSCLLTFATSAAAECAWVAWVNLNSIAEPSASALPLGGLWSPLGGFSTRAQCDRIVDEANAERRRRGDAPAFFTCLPDTVDPRGPKTTR